MKTLRLSFHLPLILFLMACAAPESTRISTQKPPTAVRVTFTPTLTVTPDPALGTVEGNLYWLPPGSSAALPIPEVTLQLDRHTGEYLKYKSRSNADGHYVFNNVELGEYGFGIYLNLRLGERKCDAPEYVYSRDLEWVHYSTWSKVDVWYDVIFSSVDITIQPHETVGLDFTLKCP